ncbi:MAG: IscA/HesB family protein [Proteobacteria bacterium]|nr:IscA/HesB family protein [Pseudomonadota bacterium]MBU1417484.1 IscA/HesB family protein [Pseudomonadota bacterium]MBU1454893.1 IscA/HesB family protein [Pseudomonadota bacterium]
MLEVTESALGNIKDYLSQQQIESAVRITIMSGGCSGPKLGLAVDEAKESDKVFDHDGVSFVVDKELSVSCGAIKVDFIVDKSGCGCGGGGFAVTSEKAIAGGNSGCSCSSGSCG